MANSLMAGAAAVDITPREPVFLYGYPRAARISTGVHDPLLCSALYLSDGDTAQLLIACDVIFIDRTTVQVARSQISQRCAIPASQILISATHTHSGPVTVNMVSNAADAVVPPADRQFLDQLVAGIVAVAMAAQRTAELCELGLALADGSCVGTNRHDPNGPSDPEVPILVVREKNTKSIRAILAICSMHPTVLHEDSTLVSGDFPAMTRQYLHEHVIGPEGTVIYHTGPCGNLSPRHVTRANTFDEAARLGVALGEEIRRALDKVEFRDDITLACNHAKIDLPTRKLPTVVEAEQILADAEQRLTSLRRCSAEQALIRTAECDWFGAEETLTLSRADRDGRVAAAIAAALPAEISLLQIGPWALVGWPGEVFVEFAIVVKRRIPNCYIISLANGELQGYLVTDDAVRRGTYEAFNAVFASPESGRLLVEKTIDLINRSR